MSQSGRRLAEFMFGGKKYLVDADEINEKPGALRLPDGTLIDRARTMLINEYGERLTIAGRVPAFGGDNEGPLPILSVIDARLASDG